MKLAREKRLKYIKQACENGESTRGCFELEVPLDNDEEDLSLSIEPVGKKSSLVEDNNDSSPFQKLASIRSVGNQTVPPQEIEEKNQETDETGGKARKSSVLSPIIEHSSSEAMQIFDEEVVVYGTNVEKMTTMINDGDDGLIQTKLTPNADNNESTSCPNEDKTTNESNIHINASPITQVHDCLVHDIVFRSEETTTKSSEQYLENQEKSNEDIGNDSSSYEKRLNNAKMLAPSIEERIIDARRDVALLIEKGKLQNREKSPKFA
ncbi:unnamed protein product [Cochlearia groenlandica]